MKTPINDGSVIVVFSGRTGPRYITLVRRTTPEDATAYFKAEGWFDVHASLARVEAVDMEEFSSEDDCYAYAHRRAMEEDGLLLRLFHRGGQYAEFFMDGARWESIPFEHFTPGKTLGPVEMIQ